MKINNISLNDTLTLSKKKEVDKATKAQVNSANVTVKSTASDAVTISEQAKDVKRLTQALKDLPDMRENKVSELKSAIENGTYNVSSKAIAAKIVNDSLNDIF